ncbi:hypothetical protein [Candidatus Uabimicrobium sp. HlEnr_7]|uniref:hypothetical protein n=1 Tax=Candidatus Uabimicrobium helgolandensis TaxID=3095367 RepID=UPI0035592AC3
MKRLLFLSMLMVGSLFATNADERQFIQVRVDTLNNSANSNNRIYAVEELSRKATTGSQSLKKDIARALILSWKNDKAGHPEAVKLKIVQTLGELEDANSLLTILKNEKELVIVKVEVMQYLNTLAARRRVPVTATINALINNLQFADLQDSAAEALTTIGQLDANKVIWETFRYLQEWQKDKDDSKFENRSYVAVQILLNTAKSATLGTDKANLCRVLTHIYSHFEDRHVARVALEGIDFISPDDKTSIESFIQAARKYPEDYADKVSSPIAAIALGKMDSLHELIQYYSMQLDQDGLDIAVEDVLKNRHKAAPDNLKKCEQLLVIRAFTSSVSHIAHLTKFNNGSNFSFITKYLLQNPIKESTKVVLHWFIDQNNASAPHPDVLHSLLELVKKTSFVNADLSDNQGNDLTKAFGDIEGAGNLDQAALYRVSELKRLLNLETKVTAKKVLDKFLLVSKSPAPDDLLKSVALLHSLDAIVTKTSLANSDLSVDQKTDLEISFDNIGTDGEARAKFYVRKLRTQLGILETKVTAKKVLDKFLLVSKSPAPDDLLKAVALLHSLDAIVTKTSLANSDLSVDQKTDLEISFDNIGTDGEARAKFYVRKLRTQLGILETKVTAKKVLDKFLLVSKSPAPDTLLKSAALLHSLDAIVTKTSLANDDLSTGQKTDLKASFAKIDADGGKAAKAYVTKLKTQLGLSK